MDRNRAADLGVSLRDRRPHARDHARLAHRDHVRRSRAREYNVILQGASRGPGPPNDLDNIYVRSDRTRRADSAVSSMVSSRNRRPRPSSTASTGCAPSRSAPDWRRAIRMGEAIKFFARCRQAGAAGQCASSSSTASRANYLESSQAAVLDLPAGALLIVFLVLAAQFESFTCPLVIMATVPLAIVGAHGRPWLYGESHQYLQPDRRS